MTTPATPRCILVLVALPATPLYLIRERGVSRRRSARARRDAGTDRMMPILSRCAVQRLAVVLALAAAAVRSVGAQGPGAVVMGKVVDSTGAAVPAVEVRVTETGRRTRSAEDGRFELSGLPSGTIHVIARRIGFAPADFTLTLDPGEQRDVTIALVPFSVRLDEVKVLSPRAQQLYADFEKRRASEMGRFMTSEEIEKRDVRLPSDLFRGIPGLRVINDGDNNVVIESSRESTQKSCPMRFFLNGVSFPLNGVPLDAYLDAAVIAAIEVYRGLSTVPSEFAGEESRCGVIVIWTKAGK